MDGAETNAVLRNLDRRVAHIEQILPTLPTRDEMHAAISEAVAPLATKEELHAAIAATREELYAAIREEGERTRRHFDVVSERNRDDIKVIAEGHMALKASMADLRTELKKDIANHGRRLATLEAAKRKRR